MSTAIQEPADHSPFKTIELDNVTFTIGTEAADTINVGIQFKVGPRELVQKAGVLAYLSDDANGNSIAATAPDGGVAIGTDGLAIPLVADKAFQLISEDDGDIDLDIVESGAATWYLAVLLPSGEVAVSDAVIFAA